ncbi:MAG: hypothetical protein V3W41_09700 [Planctomycetota bacterium]
MKTLTFLSALALAIGLSSSGLVAQEQQTTSGTKSKRAPLQGKVPRYTSKMRSKVSIRKKDYSALVVDPVMAAKMSEEGAKVLTTSEYAELKERRLSRLKNPMGRSLSPQESSYIDDYEEASSRRNSFVKNDDVEDESFKYVLWLVSGIAAVGGVFYYWRRHL